MWTFLDTGGLPPEGGIWIRKYDIALEKFLDEKRDLH
jgi:hypothetical protein